MGLFRKRKRTSDDPHSQVDLVARLDALRDQRTPTQAMPPAKAGLLKFLSIGDIIRSLTSIIKDPNGKISSKRAGAGALIVAGIAFLDADPMKLPAACACFITAMVLFFLTKWDPTPEQDK